MLILMIYTLHALGRSGLPSFAPPRSAPGLLPAARYVDQAVGGSGSPDSYTGWGRTGSSWSPDRRRCGRCRKTGDPLSGPARNLSRACSPPFFILVLFFEKRRLAERIRDRLILRTFSGRMRRAVVRDRQPDERVHLLLSDPDQAPDAHRRELAPVNPPPDRRGTHPAGIRHVADGVQSHHGGSFPSAASS